MHLLPVVPAPEDLSGAFVPNTYTFTWSNPEYYSDGSLFDDIEGIFFYFIRIEGQTELILKKINLDVTETYQVSRKSVPVGTTHFGVVIFTSMGEESKLIKNTLPK